MLVYIISLLAGAIIGFIGSKLFKGQGWGVVENSIAAGVGGILGNYFLVDFFHSFENFYLVNALPAAVGAVIALLIVMFIGSYDTGSN